MLPWLVGTWMPSSAEFAGLQQMPKASCMFSLPTEGALHDLHQIILLKFGEEAAAAHTPSFSSKHKESWGDGDGYTGGAAAARKGRVNGDSKMDGKGAEIHQPNT